MKTADIKFTKCELQRLFRIATSETHFIFNGSIFDQIDAVAMGAACSMQSCLWKFVNKLARTDTHSQLVPVSANLFMGFHEHNSIEQATNVKPIF